MKSRYTLAKEVFLDSIDTDDYIEIPSSLRAYERLAESLAKPLKMILLFGRPGTGKSILLNRLYHKNRHQKEIHYLESPATSDKEFFARLYKVLFGKSIPTNKEINFSSLVEYCKNLRGKREIIFLLDEAQMYSSEVMEKIRLLSDTRALKFVVSLHKTEDEDLIAKEHFQSRIWEAIELENASQMELTDYIHKKLLKKNLFEIANSLKPKEISFIYQYTEGNYRECNKMMFTLFDICEYYDMHEPIKINHAHIHKKLVEMAAIKLGFLDV